MGKKILNALLCAILLALAPAVFASEIRVSMEPYRYVDVEVRVRPVTNIHSAKDLGESQKVTLMLSRVSSDSTDDDFEQAAVIEGGSSERVRIPLVPGTYELEAMLIQDENYVIPGETRTYCKGLTGGWDQIKSSATSAAVTVGTGAALHALGLAGAVIGPVGWVMLGVMGVISLMSVFTDCIGTEESIDIPAIEMDQLMLGGAVLSEETGSYWHVSQEFLDRKVANREKIIFYVFETARPVNVDSLSELLSAHTTMSQQHPNLVKPS